MGGDLTESERALLGRLATYRESLVADDRNDESLLGGLLAVSLAIASAAIALGSTPDTAIEPKLLIITPLVPAITLSWALTIKVRQRVREDEALEVEKEMAQLDSASVPGKPYATLLLSPISGRWVDKNSAGWPIRASLIYLAAIGPVVNILSFLTILYIAASRVADKLGSFGLIAMVVIYLPYSVAVGIVTYTGVAYSLHSRLKVDRDKAT